MMTESRRMVDKLGKDNLDGLYETVEEEEEEEEAEELLKEEVTKDLFGELSLNNLRSILGSDKTLVLAMLDFKIY